MWVFLAFKRLSHFYIKYACKAHREEFSLRCSNWVSLAIMILSTNIFTDFPMLLCFIYWPLCYFSHERWYYYSPFTQHFHTVSSLSVSCQNCHNFIDLIIIIQRSENIFPGYINLSIPPSFYLLGHRLLSLLKTLIIIHYGYKTEGLAEGVVEIFNERRSKSL